MTVFTCLFVSPLQIKRLLTLIATLCLLVPVTMAQTEASPAPKDPPPTEHQHHVHGDDVVPTEASAPDPSGFLMEQASGTARNPAITPMEMSGTQKGDWSLMFHGLAYLNSVEQTGPRGHDKVFSTNWVMGMAQRPVGRGSLMLRTMLSFEPATVSDQLYPELFQTGETAYGNPIVDGQHPHDFFMELGVSYAMPLGRRTLFNLYVAPVGDPALGPVAFPHRASAAELPQAVLGHHFQDSTHIAVNVITAGLDWGLLRAEASAFHGGEPDEKRWDIESGEIDSWAVRLSLEPSANWTAQISRGALTKPEALEPGDAVRTTASVSYTLPLASGAWSSSLIAGRHYKESHDITLNSLLAETVVNFWRRNYVTARFEMNDKDELFPHRHAPGAPLGDPVPTFEVKSYTLGYTFDVLATDRFRAGVGGNYTYYQFPSNLSFFYGEDPRATYVFLRLRTAGGAHHHGH